MKKTHNLKDSDYTFTSEVGEFRDRFEIVFKLNPSNNNTPADIAIQKLGFEQFIFSSKQNMGIESLVIYDFLGNIIYSNQTPSGSRTFTIPQLENKIYIAKILMDNGETVIKKFVNKK